MEKVNDMLDIDIFRKSSQKKIGVLRGPKRHQDALLAKTMVLPIAVTILVIIVMQSQKKDCQAPKVIIISLLLNSCE